MKRILFISLIALLAVGTGAAVAAKDYPKRNITTVMVWGAGGGTDVCNRIVMADMAGILGVNINVINKAFRRSFPILPCSSPPSNFSCWHFSGFSSAAPSPVPIW